MRRTAAFLAALALALSLAACGTQKQSGDTTVSVNGMTDRLPRCVVAL